MVLVDINPDAAEETKSILDKEGGESITVQADVTSTKDLWESRGYIIDQMGGKRPDLIICNSGLTEKGYRYGRASKRHQPMVNRNNQRARLAFRAAGDRWRRRYK